MTDKKETKRVFVELEMIEGVEPGAQVETNALYPHSGTFLLKRTDGMMSVVNINKGVEPYPECAMSWQEVFVPNANTLESQFVMDSRDVDAQMNAMIRRYDDDVARRKHDLEQEYDKKRMELEHDYQMRMKDLETEMPKRFEQGEWVSGKTLTEIVKALASPHMVLGAEHLLPQVFDKKED